MTPQAQLAMLLWLPITLYIFSRYPARTAIIYSFLGGLLFLPQRAGFLLPLIPDYGGMVATCYGIFIGIILFDFQQISKFKLSIIDIPMLLWCTCPLVSSLSNSLGLYDGINASLEQIAIWGLPYLLGRLYLSTLSGLKELAINILKAGLIYVPLCLYEIRMSPQLHRMVYGYFPHGSGFAQVARGDGWRPTVFMSHGLVVAMFMTTVVLIAIWLWQSQTLKQIWGQKMLTIVCILVVTFIQIKSSGAYGYFAYGLVILFIAKWTKSSLPLLILITLMIYYLYLGVTGNFDGQAIVDWISQNYDQERAESLQFRFENETLLRAKAQEQWLFGWGGWGRNRVYAPNWRGEIVDVSVTDSYWIIIFGINGVYGLVTFTLSLLLPVVTFGVFRYPAKTWFDPKAAPAAVLAVCLTLFFLDSLINVTLNPTFPLICGGLSGLVAKPAERLSDFSPSPPLLDSPKLAPTATLRTRFSGEALEALTNHRSRSPVLKPQTSKPRRSKPQVSGQISGNSIRRGPIFGKNGSFFRQQDPSESSE